MTLRERHQARLMLKAAEEILRELLAFENVADKNTPACREAIRKVDEFGKTLEKVLPWLPPAPAADDPLEGLDETIIN